MCLFKSNPNWPHVCCQSLVCNKEKGYLGNPLVVLSFTQTSNLVLLSIIRF